MVFTQLGFLSRNYWNYHPLMANNWEIATLILEGILNSGLSCLFTTVHALSQKFPPIATPNHDIGVKN